MAWYNSGNWSGLTVGTDLSYILRDLVLALNERQSFAQIPLTTVITPAGTKSNPSQSDIAGSPVGTLKTNYIDRIRSGIGSAISGGFGSPISRGQYVTPNTLAEFSTVSDFLTFAGVGSSWTSSTSVVDVGIYDEIKTAIEALTVWGADIGISSMSYDRYKGKVEDGWNSVSFDFTDSSPNSSFGVSVEEMPMGVWWYIERRNLSGNMALSAYTGTLIKSVIKYLEDITTDGIDLVDSLGNTWTAERNSPDIVFESTTWPTVGSNSNNISVNYDTRPSEWPFSESPIDPPVLSFMRTRFKAYGPSDPRYHLIRVYADVSGDVSY